MNKKLISEELKRHRQLLEYQFIANETMKDGDDEQNDPGKQAIGKYF